MEVRPAVPADARGIAEVHVASWQGGYRGLLPQPMLDGLHPDQRVGRWAASLEHTDWPRCGALVAEDAAGVLGFVHLWPTVDADQDPLRVGQVSSLYVRPEAWGRGVGARLMASAVDVLADAFDSATLWVLGSNARAIRFYTRQGWTPDGEVKDDVIGGATVEELRYRRELG